MKVFLYLVLFLSTLARISNANVVKNAEHQDLERTVLDLAAKVEKQQDRISRLESLLKQTAMSEDSQHSVAKRGTYASLDIN